MRRLTAALVATALAVLGVVGAASTPAHAHDVLVGTSPEDGAVLSTAPGAVEMTFNNAIQDRFAQVAVLDANDNPMQQGEPQVSGPTVAQPVGELPDGDYTVSFRIVSSDGHPVSGTFAFTVRASAGSPGESGTPTGDSAVPPNPEASPTDSPTPAHTADPDSTATDDTTASTSSTDDGLSTGAVIAVVAIAAVLVAGIAFVAVGGFRRGGTEDTGS